MGSRAVTEPAITNLMNHGAMTGLGLLRAFEKFLRLCAIVLARRRLPDDDQRDGYGENQCGDGVDFRRDAARQASPDFEGGKVLSRPMRGRSVDGDFVHDSVS